ncbi:MAG: TIGR01777 family oxidoreductase [Gemmatimonadota bacterium]
MKIAITGASGLVGSALTDHLRQAGHTVTRLVRSRDAAAAEDALYWRPAAGEIDAEGLAGHDAVINLAGENIFGVWTEPKKRRIRDSRVKGTTLLAETLAGLDDTRRPATLVNASAIGYYGDRPADQPLPEEAPPGESFMARVVQDWEAATRPAADAGVRVVMTRFGPVLDPDGLLLQGMTAATRLGLGAALGSGDQPFPWTTRHEIARVMAFLLERPDVAGPVNVVGPEKVTNEEFADAVARVLHRPRLLKIPSFAVRLLGDLGDELLRGAWVVPAKLEFAGYEWQDPTLEAALRRTMGR